MPTFGEVLNQWLRELSLEESGYYDPISFFKRRKKDIERSGYELIDVVKRDNDFYLKYKKIEKGSVYYDYIRIPDKIIFTLLENYFGV